MEEAEVLISPTWSVHCRPTIAGVVWNGPIRPFLVCAGKSYFALALICDPWLYRSVRHSFACWKKSRLDHRSCVWTEALSCLVFITVQKLSSIVWTQLTLSAIDNENGRKENLYKYATVEWFSRRRWLHDQKKFNFKIHYDIIGVKPVKPFHMTQY